MATLYGLLAGLYGVLIGSNKAVGLAFWCTVILVLCVIEIAGRLRPSAVPNFGMVVQRYFSRPLARLAAVAIWLYAGWHLFSH